MGRSDEKAGILQRYDTFETKYANRKDHNGEIKNMMFRQNQLRYGFAFLNEQNA